MALFNGTALRLPGETNPLFIDKLFTKAPVEEDGDGELRCDLPPLTNFELQSSFRIHHGNPAFCFKSVKTGLQVAVIRTSDGPLIKTFVTIPTSDHPDDLLPRVVNAVLHSGSEAYPWQGAVWEVGGPRLLHSFGSVASAEETIHYLYTSSSSALGIILPVFMDHLLNPSMSESAFMTEVYHTAPTGEDGGRLYSTVETEEESSDWEPEHREVERTLKSLILTAGWGRHLEEVTSASRDHYLARLRDPLLRENGAIPFHRKYYRPDNMYVVVSGNVDPGQVIACLDPVDLSILANMAWDMQEQLDGNKNAARKHSTSGSCNRTPPNKIAPVSRSLNSNFVATQQQIVEKSRPSGAWGSRLKSYFNCGEGSLAFEDEWPKIARPSPAGFPTANVQVYVPYPADNEFESTGVVEMAWLGPSWVTDADEYVALPLLISFLKQQDKKGSVSLHQSMKMKDEDSADWNYVTKLVNLDGMNVFKLRVTRVSVPKLGKVATLVTSAVETITADKWDDDEAMREFLDEGIIWNWRTSWEWNGHHHSAVRLTKLMESGNVENAGSFRMILDRVYALEKLKSKDGAFWVNLLHKYLGKDKPRIVVCGYPSYKLSKEEEAYKPGRISRRRKELGETGLLQQEETLKWAREDLVLRRPRDLNSLFPMPNPDDIYVDVIRRYSNFKMVSGTEHPGGNHESSDQQHAQSSYFSLSELPLRTIFTNISVHQVQLELIMDTSRLDPKLRPYLVLLMEAMTEAPLKFPPGIRWAGKTRSISFDAPSDGSEGQDEDLVGTEFGNATTPVAENVDVLSSTRVQVVVDEDGSEYVPSGVVAAEIGDVTRNVWANVGLAVNPGYLTGWVQSFVHYVVLRVQVEVDKYLEGVRWLRDLMFFSDLTDTRSADHLRRMVDGCLDRGVSWREEGEDVAGALLIEMLYRKDKSNRRWLFTSIGQDKFLEKIQNQLKSAMEHGQSADFGNPGESRTAAEEAESAEIQGEQGAGEEAEAIGTGKSPAPTPESGSLQETLRDLQELQDFLRRNVDGLVLHVLGDFRQISEANGGLQLDQPWREIFLPHCGSGADLVTPFVVSSDVSEQRCPMTSIEDEEGKHTDGSIDVPVRGVILHASAEDDFELDYSCQAYLRQVVRVDLNPWANLDESVALQVLIQYLSNRQEKLHQSLLLDVEASAEERLLAYRVSFECSLDERLISLSFWCDTPEQLGDAYLAVSSFVNQVLEDVIPEDDDGFVREKQEVISKALLPLESSNHMVEACVFAPFRGIASLGALAKETSAKALSLSPSEAIAKAGKHVKRLFDRKDKGTYCAVAFNKFSEKTAREISEDINKKTGLTLLPFESFDELSAWLEQA